MGFLPLLYMGTGSDGGGAPPAITTFRVIALTGQYDPNRSITGG